MISAFEELSNLGWGNVVLAFLLLLVLAVALIQGFTEPIPVSSSGHLLIFQKVFHKDNLLQ